MNIVEFMDRFLKMEEEHGLFKLRTDDGLYYWDLMRYDVFLECYFAKPGIQAMDVGAAGNRMSLRKVFRKTYSVAKNELRLLAGMRRQHEYLFLVCSRYRRPNGDWFDPSAEQLLNRFGRDRVFIVDTGLADPEPKGHYCPHLLSVRSRLSRTTTDFSYVSGVVSDIFALPLDLREIGLRRLRQYGVEYSFYRRLLANQQPKALFFNHGNIQKALIAASNDLGVPSLEMQHGLMNYVHPAYSYSPKIDYSHLNTFPSCVLMFSDYWANTVYWPVRKVTVGNDHFWRSSAGLESARAITVISADVHLDALTELIKQLAPKIPSTPIIFKLHPNQMLAAANVRKSFADCSNVTVIATEKSLEEVLVESQSVIAIHSTGVYEALQMGRRVFILAAQDYLTHADLLEDPLVKVVENAGQIVAALEQPASQAQRPTYFEKFQPGVLDQVLAELAAMRVGPGPADDKKAATHA